ncbi:MAG: hypothetical protein COA52_20155, partial [Hyphomicrobiales bacterium]
MKFVRHCGSLFGTPLVRQAFLAAYLTLLLLAPTGHVSAQRQLPGVYFIYDSSNSMWGALPDKSRKYEAAREAMRELMSRDFGDREIALRIYGHRRRNDCTDSELVVPFNSPEKTSQSIIDIMETVRPTGRTPIDRSLRDALKDFGDRKGSIILISDGIESCGADPCALVKAWKQQDIDISVYVVGLGLRGIKREAMQCIADASGTDYLAANSADELIDSLDAALKQVSANDTGKAIPTLQRPNPKPTQQPPAPKVQETAFELIVLTHDGVRQKGQGMLMPKKGGEPLVVKTTGGFTAPSGDYQLLAGVSVIGGQAYQPVSTTLTIGTA